MKRIFVILICWVFTLAVSAQDTLKTNASADNSKIHTLFHKGTGSCKIPVGYFIEMNEAYSHFGHRGVLLPGMSMGVILNHHWTIGMTGSMMMNLQGMHRGHGDRDENDSVTTIKHRGSMSGGYGGILLEYTLLPKSKVHLCFPLTIGTGFISRSHPEKLSDSTWSEQDRTHHVKHFFVIEPGVKLVLNVIRHMQLDLGISYRYSPENSRWITSPDFVNQLTARIGLRFGKF